MIDALTELVEWMEKYHAEISVDDYGEIEMASNGDVVSAEKLTAESVRRLIEQRQRGEQPTPAERQTTIRRRNQFIKRFVRGPTDATRQTAPDVDP